jgi:hypothetical protein
MPLNLVCVYYLLNVIPKARNSLTLIQVVLRVLFLASPECIGALPPFLLYGFICNHGSNFSFQCLMIFYGKRNVHNR